MDEGPLSPAEELVLFRALRAGDPLVAQLLFTANRRLVQAVVKDCSQRQFERLELEDLVHAGQGGLLQAINRFDPEKGYRFSTYATHWVRQAIGRAIDRKT